MSVWIMGKIYGEEIRSDQDLRKATHKNFVGRAAMLIGWFVDSISKHDLFLYRARVPRNFKLWPPES